MSLKSLYTSLLLALICCVIYAFLPGKEATVRVLVFAKTKGWHHTSIPFGFKAIEGIGKKMDFITDTTSDSKVFTDNNLKNYATVVFNNTSGNVLNAEEQAAFERYIQAGGGYVGIHAAADTEFDWPWYGKLVGAWFESHPSNSNIRKAVVEIVDNNHPSTTGLPAKWSRTDEWYNYKMFYPDLHVLANLDENSYEGGTNGSNHPVSWYHEFDGGRAFYTGNGHTDESYSEPQFLEHLSGGIKYALGDRKPLDYAKAYSVVTPDQNRFVKKVLVGKLDSPMELAAAEDGRIFFTELFGNFSVYDTRTNKHTLIKKIPITNAGGTGLIGLTLDPAFSSNGFVYMYYAKGGQTIEPINFSLSRFTLRENNILDMSSEKELLKVPVQKNSGSHHGGSLAWDKDNNLYLSTGDGSSPFPSDGYAPLDERAGAEYYSLDAQRSAGNTNDFKGKILRIHPEPNGTYTVPKGNLFAKDMANTKPEIYVMGVRNPYRIAVNPKTSVLYWGDIGPDAGNDSKRGPRGYDEFNQAREAGNFGWPYFVGNNFAYSKWDFTANTAGPNFDANAPLNTSPNNTGLKQLPPAKPAMIWYPYAVSKEFPELGVGGRSAIGGTFYSYNKAIGSPYKFPEYYDGSLFVADWMRNWVLNMRFDKQENYLRNEPFMLTNGNFRRPIDMTFGKDGILYMLEYGSVYGAANEDARLVKVEYYTGNRAPIARASIMDSLLIDSVYHFASLTTDSKRIPLIKEINGHAPLRISVSAKASTDLDDDDELSYKWTFENNKPSSADLATSHVYTKPGIFRAVLEVKDKAGLKSRDTLMVRVGNTEPTVKIAAKNTSFYWNNQPFNYAVKVSDKEDKVVNRPLIKTYFTYNAEPSILDQSADKTAALSIRETNYPGKNTLLKSDCQSCHTMNKTAVGPSYMAISTRYKNQKGAVNTLAQKIINGGGGNWSKVHVMSAHPQLALSEAKEIVEYILSVTEKQKEVPKIASTGSLKLNYNDKQPRGQYTIAASYTDKGGKVVGPLRGSDAISLRYATVKTAFADEHPGFARFRNELNEGGHKSFLLFRNIDLTNITAFTCNYSSKDAAGEILVRIDSRAGKIISSVAFKPTESWDKFSPAQARLTTPVTGKHDVYFLINKPEKPNTAVAKINEITFEQELLNH